MLLLVVPSESGARTGAGTCSVARAEAPRAMSKHADPTAGKQLATAASPGRSSAMAAANRETAAPARGCRKNHSEFWCINWSWDATIRMTGWNVSYWDSGAKFDPNSLPSPTFE